MCLGESGDSTHGGRTEMMGFPNCEDEILTQVFILGILSISLYALCVYYYEFGNN